MPGGQAGVSRMTQGMTISTGASTDGGSSTLAARPAAGYRRGIDLARITAAFFIVWDHAHAPGWKIGYLALALFLMLTAFLSLQSFERSEARGEGAGFWKKRAVRLLMPWIFWCAVYRLVHEVVSDDPRPLPILGDPWSLLIGPSFHLWFLPFVALALPAVSALSHWVRGRQQLALACIGLVALSLPLQWVHADGTVPEPMPQWAFSLPLFLFGILHAIAARLGAQWMTLGAAAVVSIVSMAFWPDFWAGQMLLAALVFEIAWRAPIRGSWPTVLAGYAFGVYLMHPFFMLVAYKLFGVEIDPIAGALFTFACAALATEAFHRLPYLRQVA